MDLSTEWAGHTSEDHRATVLLRHEHEKLLGMFRRQHQPSLEPDVTRDGLDAEIVATLEMIDRIERDVFFPALPAQYTALVRACMATHDHMAHCAAAIRRGNTSLPRHNAHGERLELLAREHLAAEQTLLFDAVEREHPDLNRALYARLVDARRTLCNSLAA
jgi:hypothetical protein